MRLYLKITITRSFKILHNNDKKNLDFVLFLKRNEMKDFVHFYFEYPTSKAADKS